MRRVLRRVALAADRASYTMGIRPMGALRLPTFLGLGPGQTGTTWMFKHLSRHPDIYLPRAKELHYFNRALHTESIRSYASSFAPAGPRVAGEICPGYSVLRRDRIALVRKLIPDARLILTIRDPIERSWSAFRRHAGKRSRTCRDYPEKELFEMLRLGWSYVAHDLPPIRGDYASGVSEDHYTRIIENWTDFFPSEQLLVVFFGQMSGDPEGLLTRVCRHIGVRTNVAWDANALRERINSNPVDPMPSHVREYPAALHAEELERVSIRFGVAADRWFRERAQRSPAPPHDDHPE